MINWLFYYILNVRLVICDDNTAVDCKKVVFLFHLVSENIYLYIYIYLMPFLQVLGTLLLQAVDSAGCFWSSYVRPLLFSSPSSHPWSSTSAAEGKVAYISLLTGLFCILRTPTLHIVFRSSSHCLPLLVLWPYDDCLCFFKMKTSMLLRHHPAVEM